MRNTYVLHKEPHVELSFFMKLIPGHMWNQVTSAVDMDTIRDFDALQGVRL